MSEVKESPPQKSLARRHWTGATGREGQAHFPLPQFYNIRIRLIPTAATVVL
jgi:hypothetical protein